MGKLMASPLTIQGELHQVHLFNFSVSPDELAAAIPKPLRLVIHEDRAWISLVDVHLKKMRPAGAPGIVGLNYHHIAYRVLVDCPVRGESGETEWQRGIYFLESFSDNPLICLAGNLISEYQFLDARILQERTREYSQLQCQSQDGQHHILAECQYDKDDFSSQTDSVKALVAPLKQAFSVFENKVTKVQIFRDRWPIAPVCCDRFEVSFFKTAQFAACFRVKDVINYTWHRASEIPAVWTS